jgi:hypothetical protein
MAARPSCLERLRVRTGLTGAFVLAAASGCVMSSEVETHVRYVAAARSCCASPAEFGYRPLDSEWWGTVYAIDERSKIFEFDSGRSPFIAFELPKTAQPRRMRIEGIHFVQADPFANYVFLPLVLFLDENWKPVRATRPQDLSYDFRTPWLELFVGGPDDAARSMVIYTSPELVGPGAEGARSGTAAVPVTQHGTYFGRIRIRITQP